MALAGRTPPSETPRQAGREILSALDRAPFTRRHAVFLAALFAALAFDYAKPVTISFVIPGMRAHWELSEVTASYLAVAGLSGTMVGSVFWGLLADRIGRRTTLLWTIGIFSLATVCGLAVDYWNTLLACFVMGFGVGGEMPIVFALAAEYLPARLRGQALLFLGIIGSTAGYALAALIAAGANALYPDVFAWRPMWLVQLIPAALVLVLRGKIVPESARYLLAHGRVEEARSTAEVLVGPVEGAATLEERPAPVQAAPIPRLAGRLVALGLFSFAWGLANFGFVTWLPTLLRNLGYTGAASSAYLALSALIALPALAVTTPLLTWWSTRWTLVAYAVGGGMALLVLGVGATAGWLRPLLLVTVSGLAFFFLIAIGGIFSLYTAEVFPTAVRARGSGIVAAAGKFGGVVGPYFGGLWLGAGGSALGLQIPLATALILAAAVLVLAGVETRGRTLEQIVGR